MNPHPLTPKITMDTAVFQNVELDPLLEGGTDQLNGRRTIAGDESVCVRERTGEVENESEHNRY